MPHTAYNSPAGSLAYVNPPSYQFLLNYIVAPHKLQLMEKILNAAAASLRVDGSVDKFQVHNVHVMIKIVHCSGEEETLFLGFEEPSSRGTSGYVAAVKAAVEHVISWDQLLPCLSSIATDGENLNTGDRKSLWQSLEDERLAKGLPPLLKVWCAVHRSNLCWRTVTMEVREVSVKIMDAKSLACFYHRSGVNTKELQEISENTMMRFPTYHEVRWAQYVHQLLQSVLHNWTAVMKHMKKLNTKEAVGYLRTWTEIGRMKTLATTCDVLYLLERLQKRLQNDSTLLFDIRCEVTTLLKSLAAMESAPLSGGEEEKLLAALGNEATLLHGHDLWEKERRTKKANLYASDCRSTDAVRNEIINSLRNALLSRLPEEEFASLEVLRNLRAVTISELRVCHSAIVPDVPLSDFIQSYQEAANRITSTSSVRDVLRQTLHVNEWKPLSTALSRLIAAKPHSADVERLISSYNILKTDDRASLHSDTIRAYLQLRENMPPLANWDPRPAVSMWLTNKNRRPEQTHKKAHEQEYFNGIFF